MKLNYIPTISSVLGPVPSLDIKEMAQAQDPSGVLDSNLRIERVHWNEVTLWCDTSLGCPRPLVPLPFRRPVFEALHGLSHSGTRPTLKQIFSSFVWPGMRSDVRAWCHTCDRCQKAKIGRYIKAPITIFPTATRRFGQIHIDPVGPLPECKGMKYLLTVVDRFSRWPEAFASSGHVLQYLL